jgi:type IV pilus assembly protein PilZ
MRGGGKPGLLTLTIKDKSALYLAFMPFVKNGGLFIPTNSNYRLGDEVFMLLNLMGEDEKLPVAGKVIWVTPKGGQAHRRYRRAVQRPGSRPDAEEDRDLSCRRARGRQGDPHDVTVRDARTAVLRQNGAARPVPG